MAKAFQNTLATQKGVMTITELRGGALSGRHSLEEEHLFERAMESRRQHELSRHYENLVATVKDEISKREASLAHTAVVALDELAGEKGLDAEKTCLHAARSIVPVWRWHERESKNSLSSPVKLLTSATNIS